MKIPLYRINMRSGWKSGPIIVGVVDKLPIKSISLLLGNDIGKNYIPRVYHIHDTDMGNVHKMFITYIHRT